MKTTYLSVLQLELLGFEISVDTHIYELVQNKGFKLIGYPSHKKHANDFVLAGSGSITDFNILKEKAFVKVNIDIVGRNIQPKNVTCVWGYEVSNDDNDTRIIVNGTSDEKLALQVAKNKFFQDVTCKNDCIAHTWHTHQHRPDGFIVTMKDVG